MSNSVIEGSNSSLGGGMYINNPEYMSILNSSFINNIAFNDTTLSTSGYGGGLYYTCLSSFLCTVGVSASNIFNNNYAANSGGGIKWDDLEPEFDSTNIFVNNVAYLYGDNIACFAEKLVSITQE